MSNGLDIGPASPNEYLAVATLHLRAWKDCYGQLIPADRLDWLDATAFVQEYLRLVNMRGQKIWSAKYDEKYCGVAIFGLGSSDPLHGWIEALYVDPDMQRGHVPEESRLHVGRHLLESIFEQLHSPRIELNCSAANLNGRAFWERYGFRAWGAGEPYLIEGGQDLETIRYVLDRSAAAEGADSSEDAER